MAQPIKNLTLGSKIKDSKGQVFILVSKNHYSQNEATLMKSVPAGKMQMYPRRNMSTSLSYEASEVNYYLKNQYPKTLSDELLNNVKTTELTYIDPISFSQNSTKTFYAKFFIPSIKEWGFDAEIDNSLFKTFEYFRGGNIPSLDLFQSTWSRSEIEPYGEDVARFWGVNKGMDGLPKQFRLYCDLSRDVNPCFNLPDNILISDNTEDGIFDFIFNNPPVINIIQNISGNYGSPTNITYTATDSDDNNLTHYISFDNGDMWQNINPTRISNTYTYTHIFNELKNYNCRIKVVDSANNEVVSNMFVVSINSTSPTINIVGVNKQVVTFKASCTTDSISKVEVFINNSLKHTFSNRFDFNLSYEINRTDLINGNNSILIKATSSANLVGSRYLEANKTTYNLPPVGTKIIIDDKEYSITNAIQSGANQIYTLNSELVANVSRGENINIIQDKVNVKCALSNVANSKIFKDMKLVKTKKLKGKFEGYVEEKYELNGEGRYSTVKIESERFNSDADNEIIELQQYFDYVED